MDAQEQRGLLELAAKAVGFIDDATNESGATGLHRGSDDVFYITSADGWREWTPYTDDGDALRLAIDLELDVSLGKSGAVVEFGRLQIEELDASDPYAAVRLAIVRAAAAIGQKMGAKP